MVARQFDIYKNVALLSTTSELVHLRTEPPICYRAVAIKMLESLMVGSLSGKLKEVSWSQKHLPPQQQTTITI